MLETNNGGIMSMDPKIKNRSRCQKEQTTDTDATAEALPAALQSPWPPLTTALA